MRDVKTGWRRAKARTGIPSRCRLHDLKHTTVSRTVMSDVGPVTIGRPAGWTDSSAPVMLRRYTHQSARALEGAVVTEQAQEARIPPLTRGRRTI